jgi:hypothetical protein
LIDEIYSKIDGEEGPDLDGEWEGEWLDGASTTSASGGVAANANIEETLTVLVSQDGNETMEVSTRESERISALLSLGWRFPPSPSQYNEDR